MIRQTETEDYTDEWQDLRVRITTHFVVSLGGFIIVVLIAETFPQISIYLVFALWFLASSLSGSGWASYLCPRCGKSFFRPNSWSVNQLRGSCPHCGLKKWAGEEYEA